MLLTDKSATMITFYNINMANDLELDNIYDNVRNFEWTIEKMAEYAELAAENGENGKSARCTGKSAPDLVIKVPLGTLIKEAYGTFHVLPTGENSARIGMDVNVKFGWFFRIFITRKVYSETIDWRLARFVTNLQLTAEGNQPDDAYWQDKEVGNLE